MSLLAFCLALALSLPAQERQAPQPSSQEGQQAPAPPASAPAVPAPAPAAEAAPAAKPVVKVKLNPDARNWEPVSLRVAGDPAAARTHFSRLVKRAKKGLRGEPSKAAALSRLHGAARGDRVLVVSLFPASLEPWKRHVEVRFQIVEGYLEGLQVAAVTVKDPSFRPGPERLDSFQLKARGVDFLEEFPGSGSLTVSSLDPRPGKASRNAGALGPAEFGDPDLGFVTLGYSVRGVSSDAP